ncbi:zinc ABC transporter substrate-binding protein [Paenibacillus sp. Sa2BVA9]|uniref:Zinc ABC transporter substrate-binding protein n=2 Tax=Paenibacillus gallinarum TaxID=2762232 RepID=A0ABR8SX69_9BACL|nr:metal ABC transporter substrate-binding protein [Paenibacillus gallinarum]MBD7967918.1 zinc ABC transporter substrate-binding protein [Paenibacillus gallinarum]
MTITLCSIMMLIISACGSNSSDSSQGKISEDKFNVVTSFYPIYEFTKAIGGDDVNVINLLPTGVEPHDWTPRSQDIVNTSKAGLFLYNGAGLEAWVPNFLKGLDKDSNVKAVEVSTGINLIDSEEEDHTHEDEAHDDHAHEGEEHDDHAHESEVQEDDGHNHGSIDPHTWVSPKSALVMAENIKNSLVEADPEHKAGYEERYGELKQQLVDLDAKFTEQLSNVSQKEIVVSHQAFGYLARDYGLTQHSIMGLSPDAEPTGQDIVKLANLVKEEGIRYIFFEELVSDKLAKTLASEAGVETMVLNPVEGLTQEQLENGDNYFTLMEKNLQNLVTALQ